MIHTTEITVRGYHLDLYRHVNNARYLEFLEEARWQFMDDSGLTHEFDGSKLGLAVVNININYRRGAYVNEQLHIRSQFKKIGHRSAVMEQVVYLKDSDTVVADATITFVLIDIKTGKALTLDGDVATALHRLLEPAA